MTKTTSPRRRGRPRGIADALSRDERRLAIAEQAAALFYQAPFEAVSIRDLERATGLTRGPLYYHFSGKEEIYLATILLGLTKVLSGFERAIEGAPTDATDRLLAIVDVYAAHYAEDRALFHVLARYFFGRRPELTGAEDVQAEVDATLMRTLELVEGAIRDGVEEGTFFVEDTGFATMTVWGLLTTVLQMNPDNPRIGRYSRPHDALVAGLKADVLTLLQAR